MDEVTRLLADLVATPSVNPMGRPLSGMGVLESGMTEYLERFFAQLGVPCTRHTVAPGRDNLLARYDAPNSRRLLLFDAHQDTVPTDGMTIDPFAPVVDGNRLYGRGSCDIKGGMAAMLTAFARLVRERPKGSASVLMACTVDEEFTHKGSTLLAEQNTGADLAIVAEPTGLDIVNCHKGGVRFAVRANGVACHSSSPARGDNAIYRMARVIDALAQHAQELAASSPDPALGPPSLSVGRIEGGQCVNMVPDWCTIEVDRRTIPGEELLACQAQVEACVRKALGEREAGQVEFLPPFVKFPALAARGTDGWIEQIRPVVASVSGRTPRVIGVPYGTDAGPLGSAGMPSIVFGPGDIAQAHTKDEWVDLDEVRLGAELYYRIAVALG